MSFRRELVKYMRQHKNKPFLDLINELSLIRASKKEATPSGDSLDGDKDIAEIACDLPAELNVPVFPPHYVECPIDNCEHSMDPCNALAHYASQHSDLKIHRVFDDFDEGGGLAIEFKPFNLEKYASHCIAILAFAGKSGAKKKKCLPIVGCRQTANEGLPPHLEHLKYDLPVLIMASQNIVAVPPEPKDGDKRFARNMVVIWPTTIDLDTSARDLFCWILGKEPAFTENRSTLVEMRSFEESKDSMHMLLLDNSTFQLSMGDVERIAHCGEVLQIEVRLKLLEFFSHKSKAGKKTSDTDAKSNRTFSIE